MPVGDDATAAGYPLVPDTGDDGRVTLGAQEINRTRDLIADLAALIPAIWPVAQGGTGGNTSATGRIGLGISAGTDPASDTTGGAVDGNIYFQIIT